MCEALVFTWMLLGQAHWKRINCEPYGESESRRMESDRRMNYFRVLSNLFTEFGGILEVVYHAGLGITVLGSVLLIVGAIWRRSSLLVPYLIISVPSTLWIAMEFFIGLSLFQEKVYIGLQMWLRSPIIVAFSIFFGLVVFSEYRNLKRKKEILLKIKNSSIQTAL